MACLFGHKWNGCKCEKCGKTRDDGHQFEKEKNRCMLKCSICGKTRPTDHSWDGCKCKICGETRDSGHLWERVEGKCQEKCRVCGKTRSVSHQFETAEENGKKVKRCKVCGYTEVPGGGRFQPYSGTGVCDVCNSSLSGRGAWIVPNHIFYHSQKYRDYVNTHGAAAAFGIRMTAADFANMEAQDHSAGSAVCENCIDMF